MALTINKLRFDRQVLEYLRRNLPVIPFSGGGGGGAYAFAPNYSSLPAPSANPATVFVVLNSQGTRWLPGSLGGTYYSKGFYYSDGVSWDYLGSAPNQATQVIVDGETVTDQFVSPGTLGTWWTNKVVPISKITNLQSSLDNKSDISHNHDDRYYLKEQALALSIAL